MQESKSSGNVAATGNVTFFKEMGNFLYGKSSGQEVLDKLEEKATHSDIFYNLKECYEHLYHSSPTSDSMMKVKADIIRIIAENANLSEAEIQKISPDIVKDAAFSDSPFQINSNSSNCLKRNCVQCIFTTF